MIFIFITLICAFLWRFKGMAHPWGTQVNRLITWTLPAGSTMLYFAYVHHYPLYCGLLTFPLIWLGVSIGHGKWENDAIRSYWGMCWITCLRIFLMLMPFYWLDIHLIALPLLGMLAWPACWVGYKFDEYKIRLRTFGFVWCDPDKGSEWEEFFLGALPYASAFSALLI